MVKPKKERKVLYPPRFYFFKPAGIPASKLESVNLTVDEYEAIRLVDIEKLNHLESAKSMEISRPTFTRLLDSAHKKIGSAIVNGYAIRIEGGSFVFVNNAYRCRKCGYEWDMKTDEQKRDSDIEENCPSCKEDDVENMEEMLKKHNPDFGHGRGGRSWRGRF